MNSYHNLITLSKNGYIKKTPIKEYRTKFKKGVVATKLEENDSLVGVYLSLDDEDKIFIASSSGNYNFYPVGEISCTGRVTKGVKAIKLTNDEFVQSATIVKNNITYKGILTISTNGRGKITPINDFNLTARGAKGSRVMDVKDEKIALVYAVPDEQEHIYISANNRAVLLRIKDIPIQNRVTAGILIIDARNSKGSIEIM